MNTTDSGWVDTLIVNYLGGNASKDDILKLEVWVRESDENRKYFAQFKNLWDAGAGLHIDTDKALTKVLRQINGRKNNLTLWQIAQRIAAVLFIPMLISLLWLYRGSEFNRSDSNIVYHKVVAAFGTFTELKLPDGSKVWLNAGSTLQYPDEFNSENRIVNLVGEAYFEVRSDESTPFIVSTPYFSVKATGTRFNVRAEKNFRTPSVTLIEGKVSVQKQYSGKPPQLIAVLHPDQHMTFDTLNEYCSIQTENTYKHIAWKDGKLVFRNDNISEVARRISLQYNVDIEIKGEAIKKYRYRATFENEPLSELLRLLKISSPIDYTEVKSAVLPDGSFSRRKIIIYSIAN